MKKVDLKYLSSKKNIMKQLDETAYLMSTKANHNDLDRSIKQIEEGHIIKVSLEGLWK